MRHLLIIIPSIILLSSPLFGQETGVLFFSFENGEFVYSEELEMINRNVPLENWRAYKNNNIFVADGNDSSVHPQECSEG